MAVSYINKNEINLTNKICQELWQTLEATLAIEPIIELDRMLLEKIIYIIFPSIRADLAAFADRDPAAQGSAEYVFNTYATFRGIMYYRLANTIYYHNQFTSFELRKYLARKISELAKIKSGIEIHPAAKIGNRLVIDHGIGTVIGETCEIGDDCYILNGVILGATRIAANKFGKRHPQLGNKVEIGAFARILGPITIGNNTFISPHCIITENIPENTRVIMVNQLQLCQKLDQNTPEIYGIVPETLGILVVYGFGLTDPHFALLDHNDQNLTPFNFQVISSSPYYCKIKITAATDLPNSMFRELIKKDLIKLRCTFNNQTIILTKSKGLQYVLTTICVT